MKLFKFFLIGLIFIVTTACSQQRKYITYSVKKGETIKSIANRLDMKTKDLLRLNPDVGRRPSPNTIIIIPNKQFKEPTKNVIKKDSIVVDKDEIDIDELKKSFVIHQVKKGDTFYNLTRLYNVSEDELKKMNPELENGLKLGALIKVKPISDEEEILFYQDTIQKTEVSIAMLLPFRAKEYDTIEAKDIFKSNTLANITTDLYLGADLAIDSLINQGVNVNLGLFDTGRKNEKIDSLLSTVDFEKYDVVFGPLYSDELPKVANRTRKIPVVFPVFSRNQDEFSSSKIIKTYPDKSQHRKELLDHIIKKYQNENILIIGDSTDASIRNANEIQSLLLQQDSIQEAKIIHPSNGYIPKHIVINSLKADVGNWVVLATDDSVIASDAINSLISLPQEDEEEEDEDDKKKKKDDKPEMQILPEDTVIKVFASDKSNKFDKIDNNKLAKLGFTFTSDVYIDDSSPSFQLFNKQYVEKNNTFPSYYSIKGFDIVYDVLIRLASGNNLKDTFKKGISYRLESKFDYSKMLFSTSSNNGLFIIEYNPGLTLNRLK